MTNNEIPRPGSNSWRTLSFTGSFVILLLSARPAFAPPPPAPPVWHPPTLQDNVAISHLAGLWKNSNDAVGGDCRNYPATLDITAADVAHIMMDGQQMSITRVKVYENARLGIDIDTPPNGFRILNSGDILYFPLVGPSYCRFVRNVAP